MDSREPAGREGEKGKSAEPFRWAPRGGGAVGNTCGTVCGMPQGRYPLTGNSALLCANDLSVGACLYRLFILQKYGGHIYEVRKH